MYESEGRERDEVVVKVAFLMMMMMMMMMMVGLWKLESWNEMNLDVNSTHVLLIHGVALLSLHS